jgi:tyrosyl-tRNA synthetase
MTASPILDELQARGQLHDISDREALGALLAEGAVPFYVGFDPTAASLHIGSLVPIMFMVRMQRAGHKPLPLVGGATGMIGDPSGRSEERQLLDADTLARNVAGIRAQLSKFLEFGDGPTDARLVNNADWFDGVGYIEFLRDVGKHLTINYMMAKDSVRSRLEERDHGISYTEFSYMLLQAYDFVVLAREHGCRVQIGGSDQWGNITAGIELGRKLGCERLFGMTAPLLLDADGKKMGKTAAGTRIWLDPAITSPYAFYQYWLNQDDRDVERFLKLFSWRPMAELDETIRAHAAAPHERQGQKLLAEDLTRFVHGDEPLRRAVAASGVMFGGSMGELEDEDLVPLLADVPSSELARTELERGVELSELLVRTGLAASKGAARRLVTGGGVYVNNRRATDAGRALGTADLATRTMLLIRAGKKNWHIVRCV